MSRNETDNQWVLATLYTYDTFSAPNTQNSSSYLSHGNLLILKTRMRQMGYLYSHLHGNVVSFKMPYCSNQWLLMNTESHVLRNENDRGKLSWFGCITTFFNWSTTQAENYESQKRKVGQILLFILERQFITSELFQVRNPDIHGRQFPCFNPSS